ncbi:MAG TPA: hypothetical protein VGU68_06935, partial [Ktedonobacteraceae bacterium]|nr:hypothetical protein [Ktedonobacteraceae bacterium]
MATNPPSTVVGVFTDRSMAEQAMQALHDAGISNEQIHYSGTGSSGGFFEDLKNLFTGSTSNGDFSGLGLSDEEARYYSNEYNKGNIVIAVQAPGQEENVLSVLNRYSASSYRHDLAAATAAGVAPETLVQSAAGADAANYAAPHSFTATETPPAQYAAPSVDPYSTSQSDQNAADPIPADSIPETPTNGYASSATSAENSTNTWTPVEEGAAGAYQRPVASS